MIIHSASQLLTLQGGPQRGRLLGSLGLLEDGAVLVRDEEIQAVGPSRDLLAAYPDEPRLDANGCAVLPGFVDPHTHIIWAGERALEFEQKMAGATYLEILKSGGGILSTVRQTRQASLERLMDETRPRLHSMFAHGTTTAEAKSGYGLQTETELRLLEAILKLSKEGPLELLPTFLGAHAVPPEYKDDPQAYTDLLCSVMLPAVKAWWAKQVSLRGSSSRAAAYRDPKQSPGDMSLRGVALPPKQSPNSKVSLRDRRSLPVEAIPSQDREIASPLKEHQRLAMTYTLPFVDVFCETGAFDLAQSRQILVKARELGFPLKIHADEFDNLGGASLAAELGAVSADHLVKTSDEDIAALAKSDTVAVALPCTPFGLAEDEYTPARKILAADGLLALATDCNPGTAWCESMQFVIALACRRLKLTPAQAIAAVTINAAHAVRRLDRIGSIEPGKQADLLVLSVPDYRQLGYRFGTNLVRQVIKRGRVYRVEGGVSLQEVGHER
jgi:imidazolonepropionase-like amidohydrolase